MTIDVLMCGASNTAPNDTPGGIRDVEAGITVWNNAGGASPTTGLGTAWVTPDYDALPYNGGNATTQHFFNNIRRHIDEDLRGMKVSTSGGTWVWIGGEEGSYTRGDAYLGILAARAAAGLTTPLHAFGWLTGGVNNEMGRQEEYGLHTLQLLQFLEDDGVIDQDTAIVIGTLPVAFGDLVNPVIDAVVASDPRVVKANLTHLPYQSDGRHLTTTGAHQAGARMAAALARTETPFKGYTGMLTNDQKLWVWDEATENFKPAAAGAVVPARRFVVASGLAVTMPSGTYTIYPLAAEDGDVALINGSGNFQANRTGWWMLNCATWSAASSYHISRLANTASEVLKFIGNGSTSTGNMINARSIPLFLTQGQEIYMQGRQDTGVDRNVSSENASLHISLCAVFMGDGSVF